MSINPNLIIPATGDQTNRFFRINMQALLSALNSTTSGAALLDEDNTFTGENTFSGQLIGKGTDTNDNAAAGYIGEYVEAKSSTAANYPTSGQYGDANSISLTAGDWDVTFQVNFIANGASWSRIDSGISTTSGNSATGLASGDNLRILTQTSAASPTGQTVDISSYRMSLSGTTTVYGKVRSDYSAATAQYTYRLSARRVR